MNAARRDEAEAIRTLLCRQLRGKRTTRPALIVPELPVGSGELYKVPLKPGWHGKRIRYYVEPDRAWHERQVSARADVALIQPQSLHLYEIKGPHDSFTRLSAQILAYDATATHCTLVVDASHSDAAIERLPDHWGLLVADNGYKKLRPVREAQPNPLRSRLGLLFPMYTRELLDLAIAAALSMKKRTRSRLIEHVAADEAFFSRELLECWSLRTLAHRDYTHAYDPYGGITGERKLPATTVGDLSRWPTVTVPSIQSALIA